MDHRINMRQPLPLTPLFPGLNLTYALKLLQRYQKMRDYSFKGPFCSNFRAYVRLDLEREELRVRAVSY